MATAYIEENAEAKDMPKEREVTGASERRLSHRYPVSLPARAMIGSVRYTVQTTDVAVEGAYLVSPFSGELYDPVIVEVILPPDFARVPLQGFVVHTVTPEDALRGGTPAGMGVQFPVTDHRWEQFVSWASSRFSERATVATFDPPMAVEAVPVHRGRVLESPPPSLDSDEEVALSPDDSSPPSWAISPPRPDWTDSVPRNLVYKVCPSSEDELHRLARQAFRAGGVAFAAVSPRREGPHPAVFCIVHPLTGREHRFVCRAAARDESGNGLVIRFARGEQAKLRRLC
jgi:hypothetical protein